MLAAAAPLKWSVITSSQAFSVFSGVLAAFMFAAIVLLLTRELETYSEGRFKSGIAPHIANPIAFMFGAFFSLVIAAFLFAAMTGDGDLGGYGQFFEGTMPSVVLSLGVVQMAVSLAWLFNARNLIGPPIELARSIVSGTIVVAALFLTGVVVSPWFQGLQMDWLFGIHLTAMFGSLGHVLGAVTLWILLAIVIILSIPLGRLLGGRLSEPSESPRRKASREQEIGSAARLRQHQSVIRWVNSVSLAIAVLAAIGWNVLSGFSSSLRSMYGLGTTQLALLGGALLMMALFTALEVAMPTKRKASKGLRPTPSKSA